jgi:ubiquinone/menaquinone biosynthesis C-methylase UbiE
MQLSQGWTGERSGNIHEGKPASMTPANSVLTHFQKPTGWLGRVNVWHMNRRHSRLTDWGLQQVSIGNGDTILDVGCGGGRTVYKLAEIAANGKVYGIDHSEASVAVSRRTNRDWIRTGRVEIECGSVSRLPFPDRMFELVTAVETHYYWELPADMREVLRVLKPGGTLIVIAEAYKGSKNDKQLQRFAELMATMNYALLTVDEHRDLFTKTGYSDVQVIEDYDKGWLCATGRKPA